MDHEEIAEFVGVGARFGLTLESKEKRANQTRVALADPPDCCSTPKNKVFFLHCYQDSVLLTIFYRKILKLRYIFFWRKDLLFILSLSRSYFLLFSS